MNLLIWLKSLCRQENWPAIWGSLKRRLLQQSFLEMKANISGSNFSPDPDVKYYRDEFKNSCLLLLNEVGSLDYWNISRFDKEILADVGDPYRDIFIFFKGGQIAGMTVFHPILNEKRPLPEIGFVAISPEYRGQGLGAKLLSHICYDTKQRGFVELFLKTAPFRVPAIKTYLKVGFSPFSKNALQRAQWASVLNKLNHLSNDMEAPKS